MTPPRQTSQTKFFEDIVILKCKTCNVAYRRRLNYTDSALLDNDTSRSSRFWKADLCDDCLKKKLGHEEEETKGRKQRKESESSSSSAGPNISTIVSVLIIVIAGIFILKFVRNQSNSEDLGMINKEELIRKEIHNLKSKFPNQKRDVWANIGHAISGTNPVTTLIFLYNDNSATADCLAHQLADSYAQLQNRSFSKESIFVKSSEETSDYGVVLEEYGSKVERTNLLIVKNLHELSGNVARIFHTLCDSFAPRVNPSVYIFTLRYKDEVAHLKPIERASTVLRAVWNDLTEKELPALLSRVITNVVEVNAENENICQGAMFELFKGV